MHRLLRIALSLPVALAAGCEAPEPPQPQASRVSTPPAAAVRPAPAGTLVIGRLGFSVRPGPRGLTIVAIDLDGPAARAGAAVGDVVTGANGAALREGADLERAVKAAADRLRLDLLRGGATRQVAVRLQADDTDELAWTPFGLQVKDLPDGARDALGVAHGVMVTKIRAPADKTRLLPGDVIVAVDRQEVRSAAQFARLAAERRSGAVGLLVRRADADLFVPLEPVEAEASRGGGSPRLDERYRRRSPTDTPLRT
jgi:S1-C subfamily serine protease